MEVQTSQISFLFLILFCYCCPLNAFWGRENWGEMETSLFVMKTNLFKKKNSEKVAGSV